MDDLAGLRAFVASAEHGSFAAAAQTLGVSASAIGKSVARLEDKLGVRVLQRTTRALHMTAEGELLLARARRALDELAQAHDELAHVQDKPRGRLRISLPAIGYRMLLPVLPTFQARFPEITLDFDFSDRLVNVVDEGFDAAIRSGVLDDSRLQARLLGQFAWTVAGSPAYLQTHGIPSRLDDLLSHCCLHYRFVGSGKLESWRLAESGDAPIAARLPVTLTSNNLEALIHAAEQGLGLICVPDFAVRQALSEGRLQAVLAEHATERGQFSIVWPASRLLLPKLRVWIDFACERLLDQRLPHTTGQ